MSNRIKVVMESRKDSGVFVSDRCRLYLFKFRLYGLLALTLAHFSNGKGIWTTLCILGLYMILTLRRVLKRKSENLSSWALAWTAHCGMFLCFDKDLWLRIISSAQRPIYQLLIFLMCVKHMSLSSSDQIFSTVCNPTFRNSWVTMHMIMDECIVQGDLTGGSWKS